MDFPLLPSCPLCKRMYCKDSFERKQETHIALLCAHVAVMKKKLENICDFIWWYQKISVPLHHRLRLAEQTHGGPATGHSYDRGEGQTTIGAGPKLPSARSLFPSKALAPERAKKEKARRAKREGQERVKTQFSTP